MVLPESEVMETLTALVGFTVIARVLDVAGFPVGQATFDVIRQMTLSPDKGV